MSRKNRGQRRRKSRRDSYGGYFFPGGILLILAVSLGSFWWNVYGKVSGADRFTAEPFAAASEGGMRQMAVGEGHDVPQREAEEKTGAGEAEDVSEPWNLLLVNSENPIPEDYEVNLMRVESGEYVDQRIYEPLMEMLEDAKEGNLGMLPVVVSGYRTQEKQQSLYEDKIAAYKKQGYSDSEAFELAGQWVARPGYSEHQCGFAVDINGASYDVYLWLQENSYKYGFIFRYPGDKTEITKVAEEVWHYRYVGVETAREIYERGICLEEYLGE